MKLAKVSTAILCVCVLVGAAEAAEVTLNFNTDGQLPNAEALAIDAGSTVARYNYKNMQDEVVGGLWKNLEDTDGGGYVGYYGNIPTLATSDTSSMVSINTRIRFTESIVGGAEFYLNMRSAGGSLWLYFDYDKGTGTSRLSGLSNGGSKLYRSLPAGKTLGEFHVLTITWDPADGGGVDAKLWVDGDYIGDTYVRTATTNTNGNVELGDLATSPGSSMWEVDWVRFGNDETVIVPEPVSTLVLLGGFAGLWMRRRH